MTQLPKAQRSVAHIDCNEKMKSQKVLYIARTTKGGSAISLYHLVSGLDRNQYEPIVLFYVQERPWIANKLAELGIKTITLEKSFKTGSHKLKKSEPHRRDIAGWLEDRFGHKVSELYVSLKACYQFVRKDTSRIWSLVRAIRDNKVDLVHINNGLRHGKSGIVAAWLAGKPCICHVRMFGKLNYFDKIFDSFVDAFIYISRAIAEDYTTQDISPTKGRVIHNAVEFSEFSQAYDPKSVRREFGWNDHNRIIGLVGRLDWWKGHDYFLEAMSDICHKVPDVRGLIVGEPQDTPRNQEYYQMLRSLTKSLDLEEKVIFTGFRSDVPRLMSAFDIVVLSSSRPEPFGRVVIEGMAAGKPVVATAAGGVLDIIEDGLNGLLVPCQDSKALARAIHWLLDNKSQAQQMGAAARKRVTQKFTLSKHVAAVQKLYAAITQQRTEIL